MKNNIFKITLIIASMVMLFWSFSCQEDPITTPDIDSNLPEIKGFSIISEDPEPGDTITVTVNAEGGSSYFWTADTGIFVDASANPAQWIAPDQVGNYLLQCQVSNSSGSRKASTIIELLKVQKTASDAYWPFDIDFNDYAGENHGEGDDLVSISNEEFVLGGGSAIFEGVEEQDNGILLAGGTDLDMGTEAEFTVSFWLMTEDDFAFLFGKTADGLYEEGGKCLWLEEGAVRFDLSWVDGTGGEEPVPVNDGEWHHIAWTKEGTFTEVWIDGEWYFEADFGEWRDDGDYVITMGAAWEEAGAGWPGTLQGYMDDVRFYKEVLDEYQIQAIATLKSHWTFDTDFSDVVDGNDGEGDDLVSISTEEFVLGSGSALFEGVDEGDNGILLAGGTDLDMGNEAKFTVTFWLMTEDDIAFLFGKTADGIYEEGGKCLWLEDGAVRFDLSWVDGAGGEEPVFVNDGEWHHVAWTKEGTFTEVWIDGEWYFEADFGEWRDDGDYVITMGAAWEEPGAGWPGTLQGYMDDVMFFQNVLSEEAIFSIYEAGAP
jgi:hypothetical protein